MNSVGPMIWIWMLLSCALAVPFVYFMCPETTGKTLEEIDTLFMLEGKRHSANAAPTLHHQIIDEKNRVEGVEQRELV